ncbi:MAG: hypothetical protein U9R75_11340 [Candidatus Thermoplasmatota archaeon]|nr:hypothetical protein [Candidatus Thermoplasmatota archaeon]
MMMKEWSGLISAGEKVPRYIDNTVHQIKTPITVMKTYLELMKAGIYGPLNSDISSKIDLLSLSIGEIDHFVEQIHDVVVLGSRDKAPASHSRPARQ